MNPTPAKTRIRLGSKRSREDLSCSPWPPTIQFSVPEQPIINPDSLTLPNTREHPRELGSTAGNRGRSTAVAPQSAHGGDRADHTQSGLQHTTTIHTEGLFSLSYHNSPKAYHRTCAPMCALVVAIVPSPAVVRHARRGLRCPPLTICAPIWSLSPSHLPTELLLRSWSFAQGRHRRLKLPRGHRYHHRQLT